MAELLGRFNWFTIGHDIYEVIYRSTNGTQIVSIAKNLTREQALELMNELNLVLNDFRQDFNKS